MNPAFSVAVYCGSRSGALQELLEVWTWHQPG
jgi:hypothetical protein